MKRAIAMLAVLTAMLLFPAMPARALPAVQNPSLQSVDWATIQSPAGLPEVRFHLHWVNPDHTNATGAITGTTRSQPFGVFMGDGSAIGDFNVPSIAADSFFDVFIDIPLQNLPPSAQKIVPGGPPPGAPCPPDNHWDGNVDVSWNGPAGGGQSTWHQGKALVCPGGGKSLIHVVTGCAALMPWSMSPLCSGFSATLLEEDMVTPAPNPLPPGWHGFLGISAAAATVPGTVCCFTVQFTCGGAGSLIYVCATACDCNGHTPGLDGFDWNPIHNAAGGRDIRFHMHFHNHDPQGPSGPTSGDVFPQTFGVFLPDASPTPIGHFDVPTLAADSFFDVFFDVPANQLPPNPPQQLPGGGPNPNDPCPPDTNFIGNVDVHFANPAGVPPNTWHNGQLLIYPGAGNSYIHMTTDCADAVGATWSISGLCPGFSATLVENDKVTPTPDPIPPHWSGFIQVSATAAVPPGTTCCFDVLFDCGGVQSKVHVCVTTCDWSPLSPNLAGVDWANVANPTGDIVRFHLKWQNDNPSAPTNPASGSIMSAMFGAFVPDFGSIGNFSVPPLPPSSFFDVFLEVPRSSLPLNPAKFIPGGSSNMAIAQGPVLPCPPDSAWQGNVDIIWHDPAGGGGQGQANWHLGQLLVCPGGGNSYIHFVTNCLSTTGASWSIKGLCPGFGATLVNEDKVTPAPLILPPGWTGWICTAATAAVPTGTKCCYTVELNCGGAHATVQVCATACNCGGTNAVGPSGVDLGFGIRAAAPNPTRSSVLVRFAIPVAGSAQLEIFNAQGQRVRRLVDGPLTAGPHFVMWDGRGDSGQKLPPGTYFARLRMGARSDSHKVTLIQ